jgi:hypothetical protein
MASRTDGEEDLARTRRLDVGGAKARTAAAAVAIVTKSCKSGFLIWALGIDRWLAARLICPPGDHGKRDRG